MRKSHQRFILKKKLGVIFLFKGSRDTLMRVLGASGVSESQTMNWNIAPITDLCIYGTLCFQMSSFHFETNYFTLTLKKKNVWHWHGFLKKCGECQKIFNEPQNLKRHLFIRQKMHNIIVRPTRLPTLLRLFSSSSSSPLSCIHHLL